MIELKLKEKNLTSKPDLINSVMQIYETILVRFGIMLVGPTMGGKTTSLNILKESLQALYIQYRITPEIGKFNNIDS
jgi:dynein heavy chain